MGVSRGGVSKKAIFGYGNYFDGAAVTNLSTTNLVSNSGVVSTDTTGVGTARSLLAASSYGTDKAIFGYGGTGGAVSLTNLVSNIGVVSTDTTGVGTARYGSAASSYGTDKAIFGYGMSSSGFPRTQYSVTNLVSNSGVVSTDTTGVGTARYGSAASSYGTDKAIFGYGNTSSSGGGVSVSMSNLVSNSGVVSTDTTGVGTARYTLAAASYGTDKAIFGYGIDGGNNFTSVTNLVSNSGVVSTNTTGVGTARQGLAAASYGTDKAIFGYGFIGNFAGPFYNITNLISNIGVASSDTTGVGTARQGLAASSYGT